MLSALALKTKAKRKTLWKPVVNEVCLEFLFGKGFWPFISKCHIAPWMLFAVCSVTDLRWVSMVWNSEYWISELVNAYLPLKSACCECCPKLLTASICSFSWREFFFVPALFRGSLSLFWTITIYVGFTWEHCYLSKDVKSDFRTTWKMGYVPCLFPFQYKTTLPYLI